MREQPFGRKRSERTGDWVELGGRYERFESQPPKDEMGDYPRLTFRQRVALATVQGAVEALDSAHTSTGSGRRVGTHLLSVEQRRYDKWWRARVAAILKDQAAETSAQVIHLTPASGMRRAA